MKLGNKKIIITGAAAGIGKELVKQFLELGNSVVGVDYNFEMLEKLKEEINNENLTTYVLDVTDRVGIKKFKQWYEKNINDLDVLINNAGIIQPFVKTEDLLDETIDRVMKVNFFGPFDIVQEFVGMMKKEEETYIVNVSSMAGFFPFPYQTVYGASKSALKIFTEGLYAELSSTNVGVMVVFPGAIATNIMENSNVKADISSKGSYKMLSASDAASQIINGIKKNKFKLYVGPDSKFMRLLYKFSSKMAIDFINKKMNNKF